MKKIFLSVAIAATAFLSGCATNHDSRKAVLKGVERVHPAPQNFTETSKKLIYSNVRDPSSTIINHFTGPRIGSFTPLFKDEVIGYVVCYNVNTKNILRTYTGNRLYMYIYHGEKVILEAIQSGVDPVTDKRIAETCKNALL